MAVQTAQTAESHLVVDGLHSTGAHLDRLINVDYHPLLDVYLTVSSDGNAKLFDAEWNVLHEYKCGKPVMCGCFLNPEGDIVLSTSSLIDSTVGTLSVIRAASAYVREEFEGQGGGARSPSQAEFEAGIVLLGQDPQSVRERELKASNSHLYKESWERQSLPHPPGCSQPSLGGSQSQRREVTPAAYDAEGHYGGLDPEQYQQWLANYWAQPQNQYEAEQLRTAAHDEGTRRVFENNRSYVTSSAGGLGYRPASTTAAAVCGGQQRRTFAQQGSTTHSSVLARSSAAWGAAETRMSGARFHADFPSLPHPLLDRGFYSVQKAPKPFLSARSHNSPRRNHQSRGESSVSRFTWSRWRPGTAAPPPGSSAGLPKLPLPRAPSSQRASPRLAHVP